MSKVTLVTTEQSVRNPYRNRVTKRPDGLVELSVELMGYSNGNAVNPTVYSVPAIKELTGRSESVMKVKFQKPGLISTVPCKEYAGSSLRAVDSQTAEKYIDDVRVRDSHDIADFFTVQQITRKELPKELTDQFPENGEITQGRFAEIVRRLREKASRQGDTFGRYGRGKISLYTSQEVQSIIDEENKMGRKKKHGGSHKKII